MKDPNGLLMIEPTKPASEKPVIDTLTRKMTAAWRQGRRTSGYAMRGFHQCCCGAISDNRDHWVEGRITNSLCVHYLAYHRGEISPEELEKVAALSYGEAVPTDRDMATRFQAPDKLHTRGQGEGE
jgi:hypothetical protein